MGKYHDALGRESCVAAEAQLSLYRDIARKEVEAKEKLAADLAATEAAAEGALQIARADYEKVASEAAAAREREREAGERAAEAAAERAAQAEAKFEAAEAARRAAAAKVTPLTHYWSLSATEARARSREESFRPFLGS
eukprot:446994-Prorocentrum_minimum.AAC.2